MKSTYNLDYARSILYVIKNKLNFDMVCVIHSYPKDKVVKEQKNNNQITKAFIHNDILRVVGRPQHNFGTEFHKLDCKITLHGIWLIHTYSADLIIKKFIKPHFLKTLPDTLFYP